MIKYMYATKNKLSGNFNMPVLHDFTQENAVEQFSISALENPTEQIKELEVYYLGTFDTKTGKVENVVEYLVDLGAVIENGRTKDKES